MVNHGSGAAVTGRGSPEVFGTTWPVGGTEGGILWMEGGGGWAVTLWDSLGELHGGFLHNGW